MPLYSNRLYIGTTISRSATLSINVLLIFDMHNLTETLLMKVSLLFLQLAVLVPATVILPFATIYPSLLSHKFDLSTGVLNHVFLLAEY